QESGLVVVGAFGEAEEVGDTEVGDTTGEDPLGQGEQGGVPTGAGPTDRQAFGVSGSFVDEGAGGRDAVLDVDDPPLLVEALAVGASMAGGTAVVDVDDADATAGEVGLDRVGLTGGVGDGTTVCPYDVGGGSIGVGVGVCGWVHGGVDGGAVASGEGTGQGDGQVGGFGWGLGGRMQYLDEGCGGGGAGGGGGGVCAGGCLGGDAVSRRGGWWGRDVPRRGVCRVRSRRRRRFSRRSAGVTRWSARC